MARPTKPEGTTADRIVAFRLTPTDEALLAAIVAANVKKLAEDGTIASVRTSDVVRTLIRREALRLGVAEPAQAPAEPAAPAAPKAALEPAPAKPKPTTARAPRAKPVAPAAAATTPENVHSALVAILDTGVKAAELAGAAGVDKGSLSRFKKEGTGLSTAKLEALAKAIQKARSSAA